jgi:hypothetical protein
MYFQPNRRLAVAFVLVAVLPELGRADAPPGRYTQQGGTVHDAKTGLTWQQTVPAGTYDFTGAAAYCLTLNLDGAGWRAPSMKELQTLVDDTRSQPAIDPIAFPSTPGAPFWTSSSLAGEPSIAWEVSFGDGTTTVSPLLETRLVRCVR